MKDKLKKNLFYIIGGVVCFIGVLFISLLISLNCRKVTLNKNYTYKFGDFGDAYSIEITAKFEGEDKVTYDAFIGSESATVTTKYKISSDKNLFLKVDNDDWKLFGKVDAYEIIINSDIFESELGNMELIMKCSSALTQKTIYIVFGCVGLIGGIICFITQFLLNKKMVATDVKIQNNNLVDGTL